MFTKYFIIIFFGILCLYAKGSYLIFPTHKKKKEFLAVGRNKLVFFSSWHVVWGKKAPPGWFLHGYEYNITLDEVLPRFFSFYFFLLLIAAKANTE